tara:strand:- start:423 stop:1679 length:1257 start_codon:yes stop_codon:yes gene_type:complete
MPSEYSNTQVYLGLACLLFYYLLCGVLVTDIGGYEAALIHNYNFNAVVISLLASALWAGIVLGGIITAIVIDIYGSGKVTIASATLTFIGSCLFYYTKSAVTMEAAQFIIGLGISSIFCLIQKVLPQNFPKNRLALLTGINQCVYSIGSCIAITGFIDLIALVGLEDTKGIVAILCGINVVLQLLVYRINDDKNHKSAVPLKVALFKMLSVLENKKLVLVVLCSALIGGFTSIFLGLWAIPYLDAVLHEPTLIKTAISLCFIVCSVGTLLFGIIYYKFFTPLYWLFLQCICVFIGYSCLLYIPQKSLEVWMIMFLLFLCSFSVGCNLTWTSAYLESLFPTNLYIYSSALYCSLYRLFLSLITPIIGLKLYYFSKTTTNYSSISDYQSSFLFLVFMFGVSVLVSIYLIMREKTEKFNGG